jgi:hypothetical protein
MSPLMADFVAKRFCSSGRARSIQYQAPMRNVDSKIHAARFDRFKFLFHSFAVATFATISALLRHYEVTGRRPLRRGKAVVRPSSPEDRV